MFKILGTDFRESQSSKNIVCMRASFEIFAAIIDQPAERNNLLLKLIGTNGTVSGQYRVACAKIIELVFGVYTTNRSALLK